MTALPRLWPVSALLLLSAGCASQPPARSRADYLIGYTAMRCDDLRGQFYNWRTQRAMVIAADGSGRREIASASVTTENSWTSFARWWPDGRAAILAAWESPENYAWEREHQTFRPTDGNWLLDSCLADLGTGRVVNLTAVERVGPYNPGLAPWPGDPTRATFAPVIHGIQHPFVMDADGRNKRDLSRGEEGFTYACDVSPDGQWIAYNKEYRVYIAEKDGANPRRVDEDPRHPFQFIPMWSPDGRWLLFLAGEHYHCHPYVVRADGTGLRKLADRGDYRGTFEPLKHPDFHSAGSDLPAWSPDSRWVYFTAQVGLAVELMRVSIDGHVEQLTRSPAGAEHYYPEVSPDGRLVAFGFRHDGAAALCVADADGRNLRQIIPPSPDHVQMYPKWRALEQ
jgi:TolB protein